MNKRQHKKVVNKYELAAKRKKTVALLRAGLDLFSIGMKLRTSSPLNMFMYYGEYAAAGVRLQNIASQSTMYSMRPNRPGMQTITISGGNPISAQSIIKEINDGN